MDEPASNSVDDRFVELWGSMSSLWGINPAMARIHGVLFIGGSPLTMDEIMHRLGISRGNVSMSLAKLIEWGLVQRVRPHGDRKDRYLALGDVWEMFTRIAAQRKHREIDPLLSTLHQCRDDLAGDPPHSDRRRRIDDLLDFLTLMDHLAQQFFASHKDLRAAFELLSKKT